MVGWCGTPGQGTGAAGGGAGGTSWIRSNTFSNSAQNNASWTSPGTSTPDYRTNNKAGPNQDGCGALIIIRKQY